MYVNVHHDGAPFAVLLDVGAVRVLLPPMLLGPSPEHSNVGDTHIWRWMWELGINTPTPVLHLNNPYTRAQVDDIMGGLSSQLGVTLDPPPVDTITPDDLAELSADLGIIWLGDLVCVADEWGMIPRHMDDTRQAVTALTHVAALADDLGLATWPAVMP